MRIEKLGPGQEIALETFLKTHTDTSMFLRSNLAKSGFVYKDAPFHGDYYAALNTDGTITGTLAHFWNGFVAVQVPEKNTLGQIAAVLTRETTRDISGFSGPPDQVTQLIDLLNLTDAPFALNQAEAFFGLDLIALQIPAEPTGIDFSLINAEQTDRQILTAWMAAYDIEALGNHSGPALDARVAERVNGIIDRPGSHWTLLADGVPVSLCGLNARVEECVQVGPVWTPPEHRSNGYARIGLARILAQARTDNVSRALLFTDNPAATEAYRALGFVQNGHFQLAIFKNPQPATMAIGKTPQA